jgi:hypothetical protein
LRFIFDSIFSVESGSGYPPHRKEPQRAARELLVDVSTLTHRSYAEIVEALPDSVLLPALCYPGIQDLLDIDSIEDITLKAAFKKRQ